MLSILQVYAPTEAAGDAEIEEFYKTIDKALDTAHKTIILMGDFNAKKQDNPWSRPALERFLHDRSHTYPGADYRNIANDRDHYIWDSSTTKGLRLGNSRQHLAKLERTGAILEVVINKLNWSKRGIFIRDSYLSHLRFADDLVILSESSSQLQLMIEDLQTASTNVGLQINLKDYGNVQQPQKSEIERRIQRSWNKYWSMKEVFKSDMPINLKTRIMNSSILPCLTYGCQTWKFTPKAMQKSRPASEQWREACLRTSRQERGRPYSRWDDEIKKLQAQTGGN
ncbi:hypothetical protein EVAR_15111_1 [Eumeta japonica]|uniref:Endonuclease/exonuclease/phosphatase domain-containing protein n=1 Tax=Eumeta variegata TaxID=151549 RepID=A0A4C1UI57_EUMVA|nr:hypothetical protein EVAR_15111_1 [Eumeta japonica]